MKSNRKAKIIILIIIYAFSPIFRNILMYTARDYDIRTNYNDEINNLTISATSGPIHIDDNNPSINWSVAVAAGICTGNGTYSEPYVIEDFIIDANGTGGIVIENSTVYFKIENCTIYNAGWSLYGWDSWLGRGGAIALLNVNNSQLINNNCSLSTFGIYLNEGYDNTIVGNIVNNNVEGISIHVYSQYSNNNIISGNSVNYAEFDGIFIIGSNNSVSGNTVNNCGEAAISIGWGNNHTLSGNIMNNCGLSIREESIKRLNSYDIDNTNLVNGKPLYYYTNKKNLGPSDFTSAGQVFLVNCSDSIVSNLSVSYSYSVISLYYSNNNTISKNTINKNQGYGMRLYVSNNNNITENTITSNKGDGIKIEFYCYNNSISDNIVNTNDGCGINVYYSDYNIISVNTANYNQDGIRLEYSDQNEIAGNTINYNRNYGIYLSNKYIFPKESNNNTLFGNVINNNNYGIYLTSSNNNTISGNILINNDHCIVEENCEGNIFENNDCRIEEIPLELIILISIIGVEVVIGVAIFLLIRRKRKRIE